jgi:trimeric autotransporter adhesin
MLAGAALALAFLAAGQGVATAAPTSQSTASAPAGPDSGSPPAPGTVFVANYSSGSITEYPPGSNGNVAPTATISGSSTLLESPMTLALDPAGDLFVDDQGAQAIFEYAPGADGDIAPIANISGAETGLDFPQGVALDSAGDIFAANEGAGSITEYSPGSNGDVTPIATITSSQFGGNDPGGVAVNSAGDLFVSSGISEAVYEFAPPFSSSSTPIATLTGSNTSLANPSGLSFDPSGNLYVSNNDAITEYAASSGFNGNIAPAVDFTTPRPGATGFDSAGNLYVPADTDGGVYVDEFAAPLTGSSTPTASITGGNTQLDVPDGVAIAQVGPPAKLAFVTQPSGALTGEPLATQPAVAVEDANGNIVPTATSQVTLSITPGTGTSGAALTCQANPVAASAGVAAFSGCAISKAGTGYELHATDGSLTPSDSGAFTVTSGGPPAPGTIFVVNGPDSPSITEYAKGANGDASPFDTISGSNTAMNAPTAMTMNRVGGLFIANQSGNSVEEFAPGTIGNAAPIVTISGSNTQLSSPDGIALNSAGDLWVANGSSTGSVVELRPVNGNMSPIATITSPSFDSVQLSNLTFDSSGDLFVTALNNNEVFEFAPGATGNATPIATISGSNTGLNGPNDIAVDSSGDIFVANAYGGTITEYAKGGNGNATPIATIAGSNTGLDRPYGLDLGLGNTLFVADQFAESVIEFAGGANGNATPIATITGSNTGLVGPSDVAIAPVGPPAKLAFVTQPSASFAGKAFSTQPAVAVEDAEGNVVSANTSKVTLAIAAGTGTNGASVTCDANPVSASAGVAAFSGCLIDQAGTGYQLRATDGGLTPAVSGPFTIDPSPAITHLDWRTDPIAAPGSLKPGQKVTLTVTALNTSNDPVGKALVYLSLTKPDPKTEPTGDVDNSSAVCGTTTKVALPGYCMTSTAGQVQVTYTTSTHAELSSDALTAAVDPFGTDATADQYTYLAPRGVAVASYSWSPSPIAKTSTLAPGNAVKVTLTVLGADGNPIPGAPGAITFTPVPGGNATLKPPAQGCTSTVTLTAAITAGAPKTLDCTTGKDGTLTFTYTSSTTKTQGSGDAVTASYPKTKNPTAAIPAPSSDSYNYREPDHFTWSADPIAAPGSLKPGQKVTLTVTALNTANHPDRNALVYLSLTTPNPSTEPKGHLDNSSAVCGTTTTIRLPAYCPADSTGKVHVTYTTSSSASEIGGDTLTAAADPSGTNAAPDQYIYLAPAHTAVASYSWSPEPVAKPGTLAVGRTAKVSLTALDADGNPIPGAPAAVTFAAAPGGNATLKPPAQGCDNTAGAPKTLDCTTGKDGLLTFTYTTSTTTIHGGSDGLTASYPKAKNPPPTVPAPITDTYSYQKKIDHFTWSKDPIAATASLKSSQQVHLTVTALDSANHPVARALVYVSLVPAEIGTKTRSPDGATASCGTMKLPAYCQASDTGQVEITYTASPHAQVPGSDTLTAAVDPFGTDANSDQYTYLAPPGTPIASYNWSPEPVAAAQTLAPGTAIAVALTALSAEGNPIPAAPVNITLHRAPSSTATLALPVKFCTGTKPVICQTSKDGTLTVTYTSSASPPPEGGSDGLTASYPTTLGKPSITPAPAIDAYSYD